MKIKAAMIVVKNHTLDEVDAYFDQPLKFETDSDLIDAIPQKEFILRVPVKLKGEKTMMGVPSVISTVESEYGIEVICKSNVKKLVNLSAIVCLVPALILVAIYGGSDASIAYGSIMFLLLLGGSFMYIQTIVSRFAEAYLRAVFIDPSKSK